MARHLIRCRLPRFYSEICGLCRRLSGGFQSECRPRAEKGRPESPVIYPQHMINSWLLAPGVSTGHPLCFASFDGTQEPTKSPRRAHGVPLCGVQLSAARPQRHIPAQYCFGTDKEWSAWGKPSITVNRPQHSCVLAQPADTTLAPVPLCLCVHLHYIYIYLYIYTHPIYTYLKSSYIYTNSPEPPRRVYFPASSSVSPA